MTEFVNLHNHTTFSILDSLISIKDLFIRAKELNQKAIAITDHGSLAGAWDGLKASKETGVKLIIGVEAYFIDDICEKDVRFRHVILLAKNAIGYKNLLSLNKEGFDNSQVFAKKVYPLIDWRLLEKYHEGLICLTSCSSGIISQLLMNKKMQEAEEQLLRLRDIFGDDLGLEVQANTLKRNASVYNDNIEQVFVNAHLIRLGRKHNIKIVATSNAHYCKKEDHETHDVMLAIGSHQPVYSNFRLKYDCPEFYIKSGDEVKAFFERNYGDLAEEFCTNSIYFADKCEVPGWIDPKFSNPSGKELPEFPCKDELDYPEFLTWKNTQQLTILSLEEDKQFLRFRCEKNFRERVGDHIDTAKILEYNARIAEELDVFEFHGFSSYMLIVADYIAWARRNKIAVGPGRGSVGGSLVAFLLGIHQADPVKYNLIFARFHNKEKSSFPDIDTDFSDRDRVEQYCRQKYGDDHVARVSNINTVTPKVYARDIARACEFGGSREKAVQVGTEIADTLSVEIKTIESALEKVPLFDEYAKKYPQLKKHAAINGKYRAWATHAAGIVISKRPLTGLVPLRRDKDGIMCLEYDKDRAEENGLIKMDLLGLSTLNVIESIHKLIEANGKTIPADPPDYDMYDEATYNVISSGNTFGIFQLGTSSGTIDLCRRIKPKSLNDISYINSLTRPSARDMRNDFILTKDGKRPFSLLHPTLGRAFNNTFGFGLYEEALFFLAQDVAGWNLHSADRLRKLTKEKGKNPKKAAELRKEFIEDAIKNNVNEEIAKRIWDEVIDKFQGYGFNASHSTFYSMLAFTEAYLKAHYPIEFLLGKLMDEVKSGAPTAAGNIEKIKSEIRAHKVKIVPPDINKSELRYVMQDNKLITGLDAIKYVSDDAINDIISKRPFTSFQDFMSRVDSRTVRANTIQAFASSGCLDSFGIPRHLMYLYCSDYRKKIQVWMKKHDAATETFVYPWPDETPWTKAQLYAQEQFYLGEGFVCDKKDAYGMFFKEGSFMNIEHIKKSQDKTYIKSIKAVIKDYFEFKIKKAESRYVGQSMVKATIEDINGEQSSLTIFPDRWKLMQERTKELFGNKFKFEPGVAIHFSGNTNFYEDEIGIIMDKVYNMTPIPQRPIDLQAKKINLRVAKTDKTKVKPEVEKTYQNPLEFFEEMEDWMYDEGLIDLNDEESDD